MAKRKSRRARPSTLKGGRRVRDDVAEIEVDDPQASTAGQKIRVQRQLRGDPLARLHDRRQIDEAQYRAGRAFQRDCEAATRSVRSLDLTRERVDGGAPGEPLTQAQVRARKRLTELEHVLGRTMHRVAQAVLVDGLSIETIAVQLFDRAGEASAKYYGRLFRDALDLLAAEYGLRSVRSSREPSLASGEHA